MKHNLNTIPEIKAAVYAGKTVLCDGGGYEVIKGKSNDYYIHFITTDYYIGLHGMAGTEYENKLNGENFYYEEIA